MAHLFAPRPRNGSGRCSLNDFHLAAATAGLAVLLFAGIPVGVRAQDISTTAPATTTPQAPTPSFHDYAPKPSHVTPNPAQPPAEISAKLDPFFKGLMNNDVHTSFTNLLAGTKLAGRDDNVNALIDHTEQALSLYGKMNDYEIYDTRFVGTRTIVITYLAALQIQPIRWRFIFYKADKNWMLINLAADDSMEDILE